MKKIHSTPCKLFCRLAISLKSGPMVHRAHRRSGYWSPGSYRTPAVIGRRIFYTRENRVRQFRWGKGHPSKSQNTKK